MPIQSAGGFGYNPQPLAPYQVQTDLADLAAKTAPQALPELMAQYGEMHNVGEAQYNEQLGIQRDIAMRSLQAQMAEQYLKGATEASTNPNLASLMAAGPYYQQFFGGASPDAIGQFVEGAQRQQGITNLPKIMDASKAGAEAGTPLSSQVVSNLARVPVGSATPLPLSVADLTGQYRVIASQMGAGGLRTIQVQTGKLGANHREIIPEVKYNVNWTPEEQQRSIQEQIQAAITAAQNAGNQNNPPATPTGKGPGTAPGGAPGGNRQTGTPGTGTAQPGGLVSPASGIDYSKIDPNSPLLGGLGSASPTQTRLQPNTGAAQPPAGQNQIATTTQPPSTGAVLPGAQAAEPSTSNAPAQSNASASSPGQAKAPTPQQLPDTPVRGREEPNNKYNIALQGRALQGLARLKPADRDEVNNMRQHYNMFIIRRIGGVEYYIGKDGRTIGVVPP